MAWTTKSPIRGNQWVPLGFRALLGSVKGLRLFFLTNFPEATFIQGATFIPDSRVHDEQGIMYDSSSI